MNSRNQPAPKITAAQVSRELLALSQNSTVRMVGMGPPLERLAQHLVDQDARILELERALRSLEGGR
jgi:hypothetical protein